jgi:ribosomal protein L37AE/L43A
MIDNFVADWLILYIDVVVYRSSDLHVKLIVESLIDSNKTYITNQRALIQLSNQETESGSDPEAAPFTVRSTPDFRTENGHMNRKRSHDCSDCWPSNRKRSHDCSDCPYSKVGAARTVTLSSAEAIGIGLHEVSIGIGLHEVSWGEGGARGARVPLPNRNFM